MIEVFKRLAKELSAGRPAVMAAIIRQIGSSPRSPGSRFLVLQDGSLVGSIGGGQLEARAIVTAKEMMGARSSKVLHIRMTGKEVAETDMICGGDVDVLVQSFVPDESADREVLEACLRLLEKGGRAVLASGPLTQPGQAGRADIFFYRPGNEVVGPMAHPSAGSELAAAIMNAAPTILADGDSGIITIRADEFVIEPMISSPTVIIFGGGHISVSLAPLLSGVDFRVAVVDDRPEFISRDRFPDASHLVVSDFKTCFDQLEFTPETYAVIVTRGHLHDKTVLEEVLKRPTRYVGMIGSRRKREMIYQALREEGTSAESIERVRSPIGLEIGAETPEEIAISITAELIKTRAEGLRALKDWKV